MGLSLAQAPFQMGVWQVDPNGLRIRRDGNEIRLEARVIEVLVYLAEHGDRTVGREELIEQMWPGMVVGDEALTNAINKLRKALGDDARHPTYIDTIPKKGYRLIAAVSPGPNLVHLAPDFTTPPALTSSSSANKKTLTFAATALALVIAAFIWITDQPQPQSVDSTVSNQSPALPTPSIVVLPFRNLTDDPSQEYFASGMTQNLITDLSKISAITVIARTTALNYQGKSPDIQAIAKELDVRYVVQGSMQKANDTVRINAQLIDTETMKHLWAERYDRDFKNIFTLQDEVLGDIVSTLSLKLSPDEARRISQSLTDNPEAYDVYLQALQEESFFTKESAETARGLFIKSIGLDPNFAAAHAHLAQGYSLLVENRWADEHEKYSALAIETGQKAISLDQELPYSYWSLGRIYTRPHASEPRKALQLFEKAISLNPNFADGYMFLAITYIFIGEAEKAPSLIEKAMRLNPHYPFWYLQTLGMAQFFMMNYEASVSTLEASVEKNPNVPWVRRYLIASYGQLGMTEDAEWQISEMEMLGQPITIEDFMSVTPLYDPVYMRIFEEALRKAGVPDE